MVECQASGCSVCYGLLVEALFVEYLDRETVVAERGVYVDMHLVLGELPT